MIFERQIQQNGKSLVITIPSDLAKYLELEKGSTIIIQDEKGKYGPFASIWKKKDVERVEDEERLFE